MIQNTILRPLSRDRSCRFDFAVYDIETPGIDSAEFALCGFFDGTRYQTFYSMGDFLNEVLTERYSGYRFFAHFGGRFDVHYVFDWLRENAPDLPLEINCSGSCVIAFTVRYGESFWRFVDSYRLLPASLASLTHDFGVEHKKLEGRAFTDLEYNEHDCRGLYEVLEMFFDEFNCCSETIAAHSMRVFRLNFMKREIFQPSRAVESFVRFGYFGGRCEIYRYDRRKVRHYDVNSLYPSAMRQAVPLEYICETRKLPDGNGNRIGFYRCRVRYPPDCQLPVLPVRFEKLYFPTGDFEGIFTSMEIEAALTDGADVHIIEGHLFTAETFLAEFAETLFEEKRKAEAEGKTARRYAIKIVLNSNYGKWGQRREQRSYCLDDGREGLYPLPGGLAYYTSESMAGHILPHISATITARARLMQRGLLLQADNWYTDTDSLFTTGEYPTDETIGALHYEGEGIFQAFRLKEYEFDGAYKIKGLPRSKDPDKDRREAEDRRLQELYLRGETILSPQMAGFCDSVRHGLKTVRRIERPRHFTHVREKRARDGDYGTRPWMAAELEKKFVKFSCCAYFLWSYNNFTDASTNP